MPPTATKAAPDKRAVATRPFRVAAQSHDEVSFDQTFTLTASTQDISPHGIPPTGYLRYLTVIVEAVTAGNSANVAFQADGPFSAIDTVQFEDVNASPMFGPFGGYEWAMINKWGGYNFGDDPRDSPTYTRVTGTGATGGSFSYILHIPVEIASRDTIGALPNKSGNALYKLRLRLAPLSAVYSTAPTNAPTVRIRVLPVSWWDPPTADLHGNPYAQEPPAINTTQFWTKTPFSLAAGNFRQGAERLGNPIRNLIFILRDASGVRTSADWPDPFGIQYESTQLISGLPSTLWKHRMYQDFGYGGDGDATDAANGLDTGVFVLPFNKDFGLKPGQDTRRGYLETGVATRLDFFGTIGGSGLHTLTVLTNDIIPASGDYAAIQS